MRMWRPSCTRVRSSSWRSFGTVCGGIAPRGVASSEGTSPISKQVPSRANTVSLHCRTEPRCSSPRSAAWPASRSSWRSQASSPSRRRSENEFPADLRSRPRIRELAELRILSGVVELESRSLEPSNGRHPEFRPLRRETRGLVQVDLFLVSRHGVLDPRKGEVVDLSGVDSEHRSDSLEPDVEWRDDGREPPLRDGREHGERPSRFSLAKRLERLALRRRGTAVDEHELGTVAEVDGAGDRSRKSDSKAVELHVSIGALVDDPGVHASTTAVRRWCVEAARASPVAVALAEEGPRHPPFRSHERDRTEEEWAEDDKGCRPLRNALWIVRCCRAAVPARWRTDRRLRRRRSRHPHREGRRSEHEDRGDEERPTEEIELTPEADRPRVYQPEENRADGPRQAGDARVGPLELALFRRTNAPRHEALQRRRRKPDRGKHERREQEDQAVRREAPGDERRGPGEQRGQEGGPLAETRDESSHEAPLDRDVQRPNQRERQTDVKWRPTVAIVGVQDEEGREGLERQE